MVGHLVLQMTRYDEVHKLAEAGQGVAGGQDCAREIGENEGSEISILNGDLATFVFSMFLRTIIEEILRNGRPKQAAGLPGIPAPDKKNNHADHVETCPDGHQAASTCNLGK